MRRNISARTRSATPFTISAPSWEGSTWTRKGRLPKGASTTLTMAAATELAWASAGSKLASPLSAVSGTPLSLAYWFTDSTWVELRPVVARMPAYTVWPASAKRRAARAPKPLDAPVMTITCFMVMLRRVRKGSDDAAVDAQHLSIDPGGVRTGEKRDDIGDV